MMYSELERIEKAHKATLALIAEALSHGPAYEVSTRLIRAANTLNALTIDIASERECRSHDRDDSWAKRVRALPESRRVML